MLYETISLHQNITVVGSFFSVLLETSPVRAFGSATAYRLLPPMRVVSRLPCLFSACWVYRTYNCICYSATPLEYQNIDSNTQPRFILDFAPTAMSNMSTIHCSSTRPCQLSQSPRRNATLATTRVRHHLITLTDWDTADMDAVASGILFLAVKSPSVLHSWSHFLLITPPVTHSWSRLLLITCGKKSWMNTKTDGTN